MWFEAGKVRHIQRLDQPTQQGLAPLVKIGLNKIMIQLSPTLLPHLTMPKFVPRQRKHKINKTQSRNGRSGSDLLNDPNTTEILSVPKTEKEEQRRQMKEDLRRQQPKLSSKKQKRLDKYIV